MRPAADKMDEALAAVTIRPPAVPVVANVTAAETNEPETIRRLLVEQVTGRVRWRESVLSFRALGVETTVESGGNKVLTGMVRRIDKECQTLALDTPADIEAFARTLVMCAVRTTSTGKKRHVRSRRARHGCQRRHRRGHRQGAARAGRHRGSVGDPRRGARSAESRNRQPRHMCAPAISPMPPPSKRCPRRRNRPRAPIDILVNNAGITRDNLFMRMKDEEWDQVIAVDLTAAFRLSRAVLRGMMKKRWGASSRSPPWSARSAIPARATMPRPRPA